MDITLDPIVVFILKLNTPDKHKGLVQLNPYLSKLRQQPHITKTKKTPTKHNKIWESEGQKDLYHTCASRFSWLCA